MAMSHDVKLPVNATPKWPERCVVCDRPSPNHCARFVDRKTTLWTTLTLQFAKKVHVTAPACADCASGLERREWIAKIGMWVTLLGGLWFGREVMVPRWPSWPPGLVMGACALAAYAPLVALRVVWAPAFAITAWGEEIEYEFANEAYAHEFAEMNEARVS